MGSDRTPVAAHIARVDALLAPLRSRAVERVPLAAALGRVTAAAVVSPMQLPPFRNSQMDGFAVRAADVAGAPLTLPVVGEVAAAAGSPAPLQPGTVVRIMTGAPVPEGADAVVPVEDTRAAAASVEPVETPAPSVEPVETPAPSVEPVETPAPSVELVETTGEQLAPVSTILTHDLVTVLRPRTPGEYIREPGSDVAVGAQLLPAGLRLASRHLAVLAAAGLVEVPVTARVRLAVISTGSELVAPGEALGPGQIPDANGVALVAAASSAGADVVATARVHDRPADLAAAFDAAIDAGAELLLTSGGVSMGDHEVVRDLLEPLGAHVDVLAMQPGGPQALANYRGVPVVCLPGNPVSSQLSFELFVAPLLRELSGLPEPPHASLRLESAVRSVAGRRQFLRGRRLDDYRVATVSGPGSHLVAGLAASDLIIDIPEDVVELAAGDPVETWELL